MQKLLEELKTVAQNEDENIMPVTIKLVKAGASMGDIVESLKGIWGVYRENPVFSFVDNGLSYSYLKNLHRSFYPACLPPPFSLIMDRGDIWDRYSRYKALP